MTVQPVHWRVLAGVALVLFFLGIWTVFRQGVAYDSVAVALLITLSLFLIGVYWWSTQSIPKIDLVRREIEVALHEAHSQLTSWVGELEQRNSEINHLSEVGNLLQSCLTPEDAYTVVGQAGQQLFPERAGALYVMSGPGGLFDTVAAWGTPAPVCVFVADECWAVRRSRPHLVDDSRSRLVCHHLSEPLPPSYLCVPMVAWGEVLGVLHLQSPSREPVDGAKADEAAEAVAHLTEAEQRLAVTFAEQIALALANLRLREDLRVQAIRDPLTGLFNRRYMEESLEREIRRGSRRNYTMGVIMLDIDHFARFNETFGRSAGDALLRTLGEFLGASIRREDIACRYGGEEFTLVLPEASLEATQRRAEQLREAFKRLKVYYQGKPLMEVSLSLGVAMFPQHGVTKEALLRAASEALSRAKLEGRDRVSTAA